MAITEEVGVRIVPCFSAMVNPSFLSKSDRTSGTFCDPNKGQAFICQSFED